MFLRLIILSTFLFVLPLNAVKYDKLNPNALYERAIKYLDKEDYSRAIRALKSYTCLLYTSPSPRDESTSRMPSSA